jgi:hypothetical protein
VLVTLLLVGFPATTFSERPAQDQPEQAVRKALEATSKGYYTGSTEKNLEKLGDASAVELIRIYGDRDLSAAEVQSTLLIVDLSFSAPQLVTEELDRKPKAAMLLLKYLECETDDTRLKQKIVETRRSLGDARRVLRPSP